MPFNIFHKAKSEEKKSPIGSRLRTGDSCHLYSTDLHTLIHVLRRLTTIG